MCLSRKSLYTMEVFLLILILGLASSRIDCQNIIGHGGSFNVLDYGAIGDGRTNDTQAFLNAWRDACWSGVESPVVIIPQNFIFLVYPLTFWGPCNSNKIYFMISGEIIAPSSLGTWKGRDASEWVVFRDVKGLTIDGSGTIDGQGKAWWDHSCAHQSYLKGCTRLAPTALKFVSCNETSVSNMYVNNSPQTHILVLGCHGFNLHNIFINSPVDSPNTDGIHIQSSHRFSVTHSIISTGDDCVSIGDYTSDVEINNIVCGPGHGISIGSLGKSGNIVQVESIHVSNVYFSGTTNGARIKTWQVGRGTVRDVIFENLLFNSVQNPIIIDQHYCNVQGACKDITGSGVKISNIVYRNIFGTSSTDVAINLNCSKYVPCTNIVMQFVQLSSATPWKIVSADCENAYGQEYGVGPSSCLLQS
ncbi:PREDICTED: probable polygalacturonase At1g80170 [Ipomoea nil]|uniref:probable polygalacturonase At1g80170 n=1 Tax=Ipomoea nil TaxID=35883 RepID=UPI000901B1C6|nr:PREDICTED: probable polygalacturonase At1g80170 [Ipomoea nil]